MRPTIAARDDKAQVKMIPAAFQKLAAGFLLDQKIFFCHNTCGSLSRFLFQQKNEEGFLMSDLISALDEEKVREFRKNGNLVDFSPSNLRALTRRGGATVGCSDDTIDAFAYHRIAIPEMRPIRIFGLPLILIPSFPGYDAGFAKGCFRFLIEGMQHKNTQTVFNLFHHPCGIGLKYKMTLDKIIFWAAQELLEEYRKYEFFDPKKIFMLLHLKRQKGQKTYLLNPPE